MMSSKKFQQITRTVKITIPFTNTIQIIPFPYYFFIFYLDKALALDSQILKHIFLHFRCVSVYFLWKEWTAVIYFSHQGKQYWRVLRKVVVFSTVFGFVKIIYVCLKLLWMSQWFSQLYLLILHLLDDLDSIQVKDS